jgi:2-polyprenyl-3-methyl-5-hydroxy-6-metoxy-1,4-benzoquinol methylase
MTTHAVGSPIVLHGEYEERGEYHRQLDKNWKYYPVFVHKMRLVRKYLNANARVGKTIDLGCGEGILVEEYRRRGFDIVGLDYNYESDHVIRGDMTRLSFADESFDLALALDVIEHLSFEQQSLALAEIRRILKPGGRAILTIPNLAHFASRVTFALFGKLLRTSSIDRHPGDRPIGEYLQLCREHGLEIVSRKGLFPTYPLIAALTYVAPSKVLALHGLYNRFAAIPGYCFLNVLEVQKGTKPPAARSASRHRPA